MSDDDVRENDVSRRRRRTASILDGEAETLNTSPFEGDLAEELAKTPRARRLPGLTTCLCICVLLAAGFVIGAQTDRHFGKQGASSPQAARTMPGGGMPGMAGGGMRGPGGGSGGQGSNVGGAGTAGQTTGTVQKIDGKTIYVRTADGVVQVQLTGTTKIRILQNGSAKDLKSGTNVVVQGSPGKDGAVTATSVRQGVPSGG